MKKLLLALFSLVLVSNFTGAKTKIAPIDLNQKFYEYIKNLGTGDLQTFTGRKDNIDKLLKAADQKLKIKKLDATSKNIYSFIRERLTKEQFLIKNISSIAPVNEVLGGKFYVTDLIWTGDRVIVSYEDGHNVHKNLFGFVKDKTTYKVYPMVNLGEEFEIGSGKQIKLSGKDVFIKVNSFINSPCPEGAQCFWIGQGINTSIKVGTKSQSGLNLSEALGYQLNLVDSDYETYAKFILNKSGNKGSSPISTGDKYNDLRRDTSQIDKDFNNLMIKYIKKTIGQKSFSGAIMVGYNIAGKTSSGNDTRYYVKAMTIEYYLLSGVVTKGVSVIKDMAINVNKTDNDYIALNYAIPSNEQEKKDLFPSDVYVKIDKVDIENMEYKLYNKALEYFKK